MRRHLPRAAAGAVLLAALVTGCAEPSADPRAGATPSGEGMRFCPGPQEPQLPPGTPCVPQDPASKYRENHAYRQETELTEAERAGARGRAERLGAVLRKLATGKPGETEVRAAVAAALDLRPNDVEYRVGAQRGPTIQNLSVAGGHGKVCVKGEITDTATITAEVSGRTLDGTCLPGLGGH
ncbi:precorrin-3B C(17)-methyltransferase [Streptomyces sp. NPDC058955]|uniref:precorrin-3B C(17)-methyltransferase n=1 Tax=unclassified Streptomyces TaxID=2593676 RepID=UPI0036687755